MLDEFMGLICGKFDNKEQYESLNDNKFPFARHVNTVLNSKIKNLPSDFKGKFIVEESYYTIGDRNNQSMHLFLFEEQENGILLTSYDIPKGFDKQNFIYDNIDEINFNELVLSTKFTPTLFTNHDGVWKCNSESMFAPTIKFVLKEEFSKDQLVVSESMYNNDKKTFGFDYPIIYKRIA